MQDSFKDDPPGPPDPLGAVIFVNGSSAGVGLPRMRRCDEACPTVGRFVGIMAGRSLVIGTVLQVTADLPAAARDKGFSAVAVIDLLGEIVKDESGRERFHRGVSGYPAIDDPAVVIDSSDLQLVYSAAAGRWIDIGTLHQDDKIPARIKVDDLLSKHFAVLGTTGVGKSSGTAIILHEIMSGRPDLRILLLDSHNEYGRCFGERANVINSCNLKLPFWLFSFEELVDVVYAGRPGIEEELEILAEVVPLAKGMYAQYKAPDRAIRRKGEPRSPGFTVDTPVPYMIQDLVSLIDERMGKLENRAVRMHYHRLIHRIEAIRNDPRYTFMFENANVGGDTMGDLLRHLFRLGPDGKPITVMQLAGLPAEVVDAVVCVLCRMAFDLGLWSEGAVPLLVVCEEAHRYASADRSTGFNPTRRALTRIVREGRKYGVFLGLVTQRAAELDPTIIAQCGTVFAMRMANDRDQALLRSAVSDAAANLLDFIPSLRTGEVIGFGEGVPVPARMTFRTMPAHLLPRSETASEFGQVTIPASDPDFVKVVVDRWRGAHLGERARPEENDNQENVGQRGTAPALLDIELEPIRQRLLRARVEPPLVRGADTASAR